MAIEKNYRTVLEPDTCEAGTPLESAGLSLIGKKGGVLTAKVTNGATPPGDPAVLLVQISGDGTVWEPHRKVSAGVDANGVYAWTFRIDKAVMHLRTVFGDNTGEDVTVQSYLHEVTKD